MRIQLITLWWGTLLMAMPAFGAPISLKPNFTKSERFGETFTASFHGIDNSVFLLQYIFSNAGFGDKKAGCRLLALPKGQKSQNVSKRVDKDGWSFTAATNTLTVAQCTLKTDAKHAEFVATAEGLKAALKIEQGFVARPMPKTKPKAGFYEAEVLLAGAPSTLTFTRGTKVQTFKGYTYLDHSRSTAKMSELVSAVYRVRAMGEKNTVFQTSVGPLGKRGWLYTDGKDSLTPVESSEIRINAADKTPSIAIETSAGVRIKVTTSAMLFRYRPVESYGVMGKLASPVIGNPETATFLVKVRLTDGTEMSGVMERTLVDP